MLLLSLNCDHIYGKILKGYLEVTFMVRKGHKRKNNHVVIVTSDAIIQSLGLSA